MNKNALFCSVCLAFNSNSNAFTERFNARTHTYQRIISENESSEDHNDAAEAYLLNSTKKILISIYFENTIF